MESNYTFSPRQVEEAKTIRSAYVGKESTNIDKLREIDNRVRVRARIPAFIIGSISVMIFGVGLSVSMLMPENMIIGIATGIIGIIGALLTPLLHSATLKSERKKVSAEVLSLSDEIIRNGE